MMSAISPAEFDDLFEQCSNWGRWGHEDQRGALNFIDDGCVAAAAALVRDGSVISCGRSLDTEVAVDNPNCAVHRMTTLPDPAPQAGHLMGAASDYLGVECHGEVHSHIDALCHIAYKGQLHNGWPADTVTDAGASVCDLGIMPGGIATRGVLLDVAALRGQPWLVGGDAIGPKELAATEAAADVRIGTGDVVLIRTGHALRRLTEGPWDSAVEKAGLDPLSMPWLKEREVAALAFDGDGDAVPHHVVGIPAPIHVLGINAMGLHFFDALSLEDLAAACAARRRAAFFFVALPLRAVGATGCAINPVAMF
jgi:kynurenine formamidase